MFMNLIHYWRNATMNDYERGKAQARQEAIDWQNSFGDRNISQLMSLGGI